MHVKRRANVETTKPQAKEEKDEPTKIEIAEVPSNASTLQICQTAVALEAPVCGTNIPTVSVSQAAECLAAEETNSTSTIATTATSSHETTLVHKHIFGPPSNYCNRRSWITTERMNELRRKAQEAVKQNKTFTIRGCFSSVRNALTTRGWVEKLDVHRKHVPTGICQVTYDELAQGLPKRKPGETRRQYILKCERNITSRFLEHMPIDFLWTNRKEKCDYIDQAKNPGMTINKFHRVPFTSKEGLCSQLKDFHWFYEEGTAEMYFPRCFNVWSPEELGEFVDNFKLTATIAFIRWMVDRYRADGFDAIFSPTGTIPYSAIDFAYKRCTEYLDNCEHNDIDLEDPPRIWEHDWDAFLYQQYQMANEGAKILCDSHRAVENLIKTGAQLLENMKTYWPQYSLDGYQNLWIVKPANKCRGRGIQLIDNLKKILSVVNPSIASKSRYVVQKYIERPLIIHHTKFDIRQWFLITNVQPLVVWMYKESYLRFSSQEYSLTNHHESVHLTNHAIQKKYTNGKRDKRLPSENMWDCYSFQAYLRQIGKQDMWLERIYPGMRKAIVGTMLASQENMDRRPNTFELFGADFMICEDFNPWLIEINSSPDLGATTSVTARMCPQCLDDVVKVVIDRRTDPKADLGNFVLIYRQVVPPTPAYMGLNLFVKGKQIITKVNHNHGYYYHQRKERSLTTSNFFRQKTTLTPAISNVHKVMPTFNATEFMEKCLNSGALNSTRSSINGQQQASPSHSAGSLSARQKVPFTVPTSPCPNLLRTLQSQIGIRRSFTKLSRPNPSGVINADSSAQEATSVPPKRYRSCGPRLAAPQANEVEKKFKFIIKKCTIQKSLADRSQPQELETSESAQVVEEKSQSDAKPVPSKRATDSGVDDLLYKVKGLLRDNRSSPVLLSHHQEVSPMQAQPLHLRSQSCIVEPKHFRRISTTLGTSIVDSRKWRPKPKSSSNAFEEKKAMHRSAEQLAESSTRIHTIGRGIASWKSSSRNVATKSTTSTATTTTTTINTSTSMKSAASVYACKRNASMMPIELTRMKHQMSPRRTRRHSYQRSETRNLKC